MAVVVYPRDPLEGFPKAMESFAQGMESIMNKRNTARDMQSLAGMDFSKIPDDKWPELLSQMKSPDGQRAALAQIMKVREERKTRPVYQQKDGKLEKVGDIPQGAEMMKTDPAELELVRQRGRETLEDKRFDRQMAVQQERDASAETRQQQTTERMLTMLGLRADQKTPNEIELAQRATKGDKEASATLETLKQYRADSAGAKAKATQGSKVANPKAVQFYGDQILAGNPMPMGMASSMREAVGSYVQEKMDSLGNSPQDVATRTNVRKGLASSYSNQEKMIGMMGSFVKNIDKQVDRIDELGKDFVSRVGVKALDVPYTKLKQDLKGTAEENILDAYFTEISSEIGKLSTGSSASVAELSVSAREKWDKIHDRNLSFNERKKILTETKHMAEMRMESALSERDYTTDRLKSIGGLKVDNLRSMEAGQTMDTPQGTFVKGEDGKWHPQQ